MQLAPPPATKDGGSVVGVVPHEVEVLVRVQPLVDRRDLPRVQPAVEVARDVGVHLNHRPGSVNVYNSGQCGCYFLSFLSF